MKKEIQLPTDYRIMPSFDVGPNWHLFYATLVNIPQSPIQKYQMFISQRLPPS